MPEARYPHPGSEAWAGARDSLPMLLGAAPFGVIFGTLAGPSGLSAQATLAMSLCVFAGSSQFIALTLLASGTGLAVILLTTLVVNLRHALYSATLLPHVAGLRQRWRIPLAFWLTDETFAVVSLRYGRPDTSPHKHWYYLGSCLAMYSNWFSVDPGRRAAGPLHPPAGASGAGVRHGRHLQPASWCRCSGAGPLLAAALGAAAVALAGRGLPYKLGLMLAALAGVVIGTALEALEAE